MKTVYQLLKAMGACPRAIKKYSRSRKGFKKAFIEAYWSDAAWLGYKLFSSWPVRARTENVAYAVNYPNLPTGKIWAINETRSQVYNDHVRYLFHKKSNRIKYWPEVERRLKEIGVEL